MGMPPAPSLPASLPISRYNSAKKDNDFIYHEAVPALDTLQSVKGQGALGPLGTGIGWDGVGGSARERSQPGVCLAGAPLVKALPVNPTDPAVTGPDIFAKLVPMAAHEASSLYRCVRALARAGRDGMGGAGAVEPGGDLLHSRNVLSCPVPARKRPNCCGM